MELSHTSVPGKRRWGLMHRQTFEIRPLSGLVWLKKNTL
jgi:hypothetical protein